MKTLRLIIDRPETLAMPFVRWAEGRQLETMVILSFLITVAVFLDLAA
jgi:hypothetical protein